MLKTTENIREQMKTLTTKMPTLRSKMTGNYIKLFTDNFDQRLEHIQILKKLQYQFYTITSEIERPIKVVIKGLPRHTKTEDIRNDLIDLGFSVDRPRKGTSIHSNYTNIENSLVRPNISYAQVTHTTLNSTTPQQMAPQMGTVPATTQPITQAIVTPGPTQQQNCNTSNECLNLISQTLQQTIQALSILVQQIN
ncbi:hypothetical protein TNCV_2692921 [Trichonephila clavipes]|uniref:Pre-C2HC domain-containing protein n=1 Tax=Trichonephila clavipes TaxID=2585209 RepID=A0A8X6VZA4_TRICX|nr:hypothetical protein TNCV_2692921 [Trichonephila clavipes]